MNLPKQPAPNTPIKKTLRFETDTLAVRLQRPSIDTAKGRAVLTCCVRSDAPNQPEKFGDGSADGSCRITEIT